MSVINFIKDKLFGNKKERDKYIDFASELTDKGIIDPKVYNELCDIYEYSERYEKNRSKDHDFER